MSTVLYGWCGQKFKGQRVHTTSGDQRIRLTKKATTHIVASVRIRIGLVHTHIPRVSIVTQGTVGVAERRERRFMPKAETIYQAKLINKIEGMFPGCLVVKNDPAQLQGIPDLLILIGHHWAMLEVKMSADSPHEVNQDYYVQQFNGWSFAAFIYPENEEIVLRDLQAAFAGVSR